MGYVIVPRRVRLPWYPLEVISCCSPQIGVTPKEIILRIPYYGKLPWKWLESMVLFTNWFWLICRKYEYDILIYPYTDAMGMNVIHIWIARSSSIDKQKTATKCGAAVPIPEDVQHASHTLDINIYHIHIYIYIYVPKLPFVINLSSGQTFAWQKWPNKKNDRTRFMLPRSNEFMLLLEDYWQRPTKISSG